MRKKWWVVPAFLLCGLLFFGLHKKPAESQISPEVLDVRPSQATIAWITEGSYKGRISYWPTGGEANPLSAEDAFGRSRRHEVILTGLRPGTHYTYQIEGAGTRFVFRTQPPTSNPFSFLMVWGDVSDRLASLVRTEFADFVIALSLPSQEDAFSAVRSCVPVYAPAGADSPFLESLSHRSGDTPSSTSWPLDWGGLRLVFLEGPVDPEALGYLLNSPSAHTIGLVVSSNTVGGLSAVSRSSLHTSLTLHNGRYPTRPAAFVFVLGETAQNLQVDGITYCGLNVRDSAAAMRIDMDVDSARATRLDTNREIVLKQPPLGKKLACEDCRRLADKGAYEASTRAYREFIDAHKDHFQIEDAYYAIADLYDFKLFEYAKALLWYRRLIDAYPQGALVPLANQRIRHISEYADYDYEPLARFERIRSVDLSRAEGNDQQYKALLSAVEQLIAEYSHCRLAPVMQLWLANQYRAKNPDKAIENYRKLRRDYASSSEAREALYEIGATCYDARRYPEAIEAFRKALAERPEMAEAVKAQIARSQRNIRRVHIAYLCWGLVAFTGAFTLRIGFRRIGVLETVRCVPAFAVTAALLYAGAWLIREQFISAGALHLLVLSFAAAAGLGALVMTAVTNRYLSAAPQKRLVPVAAAGLFMSLLFYLALVYLAVYYVYEHYLIVVHL